MTHWCPTTMYAFLILKQMCKSQVYPHELFAYGFSGHLFPFFFCFVVDIVDLVHDVEAIYDIASRNLF